MSSWIDDFLEATDELEAPKSYFYWSILTTVSAIAARKVWINRGGVYNLYPNIYTFLISKRSGLRKGVPVNIAKKLAYDVGVSRVIDGQNSIQGVLKELARVHTTDEGHVIKNAEGFLVTGEFASFMLADGVGFSLTTLTDLYDTMYHEQGFKKRLASQDELVLKSPCLTALFASNETHFFGTVPKNAITGGFLARTFCVYEEKKNRNNPLTRKPEKTIDYEAITEALRSIAMLEGEMEPTAGAIETFEQWYYDFCERESGDNLTDDTGTSERLGDGIWKVAAILALIRNEISINRADMEKAIEKVTECYNDLKRLLFGGATDEKNAKSITLRTVVALMLEQDPSFEISRKIILQKGAGTFGVYDLDECIEHLHQAGMIKIEKRGGGIYYKLTELTIKRYLANKKGN